MQQQQKLLSELWFTLVTFLTITTHCQGILTRNICIEQNLQIVCECTNDMQNLYISTFKMSNLHESAAKITVQNCGNVTIKGKSIEELQNLRQFSIKNVTNLELDEFSLFWPGYAVSNYVIQDLLPSILITITDSRIQRIGQFSFKGQTTEIHLDNVEIYRIEPFAFSGIAQALIIELKNSAVKEIEAQAFKKITTAQFLIKNTTFDVISSRSFTDLQVSEAFVISNSHFNDIKPQSFIVNHPKRVEILNTYFDTVETEGFKITTDGSISFNGNCFNVVHAQAFRGIARVHQGLNPTEIQFDNNTFKDLKADIFSFNSTSFTLKYNSINTNVNCTCRLIDSWQHLDYHEHIHCLNNNQLIKATLFKANNCYMTHNWIVLIAVIASLLALMLIGIIAFVYAYRRHKRKKAKINRNHPNSNTLNLIVPDGRTYRETELHVIVEKAELLTTDM